VKFLLATTLIFKRPLVQRFILKMRLLTKR